MILNNKPPRNTRRFRAWRHEEDIAEAIGLVFVLVFVLCGILA